jgi:hypothetical protein
LGIIQKLLYARDEGLTAREDGISDILATINSIKLILGLIVSGCNDDPVREELTITSTHSA